MDQKKDCPNPYNVKAGQLWQGMDKRFPDVLVRVQIVFEERGYATVFVLKVKKLRRIQLHRFKSWSNGYRLVEDCK